MSLTILITDIIPFFHLKNKGKKLFDNSYIMYDYQLLLGSLLKLVNLLKWKKMEVQPFIH